MDVYRLDAAQAAARLPELTTLLQDAVDAGASIGFLPPLSEAEALGYWREVIEALAGPGRILLIATQADALAGTVQLDLAGRPNGRHRAEVTRLLVRTAFRRQGVGRALMRAIEAETPVFSPFPLREGGWGVRSASSPALKSAPMG